MRALRVGGAFMVLYLGVEGDRIAAAKYHTVGCGPTIPCGSMLSELVVGRSIEGCRELTADHLIEALDGVRPDKLHCPALPITALRNALSHWGPREDSCHERDERDERGRPACVLKSAPRSRLL